MGDIKISEQVDGAGVVAYHWHIIKDDGHELCHSAYHLEYARKEGWV